MTATTPQASRHLEALFCPENHMPLAWIDERISAAEERLFLAKAKLGELEAQGADTKAARALCEQLKKDVSLLHDERLRLKREAGTA